ncbi:Glycosyltransferase involved in cell wall bisynthesis [Arachidicoccus rhizosphaerae]|uniref:Glycosyltransferase involved in cell wall bisynthesis n=1 Tax=Arachidicoccus rhizosphaerae TaxID=551991 RepID=A0A1H4CNL4_9BACT|nr:glycosyltransferase [Arachidicoccus rhizosphaerae]SEA62051.1 Glycosyltransferase involved in cell wall bisynthesis [Arachidicoccus rhizosphaerae]
MRPKQDILVLGTVPPPIGGVTIHVKRLCEHLDTFAIPFEFVDFRKVNKVILLKKIWNSKIIHLHSSSPVFRFLIALFCFFCLNKKLLLTIHGNIGRFGKAKNLLDLIAISLSTVPIVLNDSSYELSMRFNRNTVLISAFIPAIETVELGDDLLRSIQLLKKSLGCVYATNASNINFDNEGNEIYQISALINLFKERPKEGLIISDPSGNYFNFCVKNGAIVPENILFITIPHDFNSVIKTVDCVIRFTTTDGDSLSVKESLYWGRPVIATNVVSRPSGTILVDNDIVSLTYVLDNRELTGNYCTHETENGAVAIIELYKKILKLIKE